MKKVSFVVAILVSAALAGCHHKKADTTPATGTEGSAMGSAEAGSAAMPEAGSAEAGSAEAGSAAM